MGDETKRNELKRGNYDPLHATRKPSTADSVDDAPAQVVQMPTDKGGPEPPPRRRRSRKR